MKSPSDILPAAARQHGDKVALVCGSRYLSFNELDEASTRIAAALVDRGVRPGQTVSLFAQNRWEWVTAYHGVLKAGGVVEGNLASPRIAMADGATFNGKIEMPTGKAAESKPVEKPIERQPVPAAV